MTGPQQNIPATAAAPSTTELLASTIAGAVERQLTQYVSAMSRQVEAARVAAEANRAELQAEFMSQLEALNTRMESHREANEAYQRALQAALEERLAEFANHQHTRLTELDGRLSRMPAQLQADVPAQISAATQGIREYLENQTTAMDSRINELHKSTLRFDEQATALVQHVNQTTQALARRMDDGDQLTVTTIEERLAEVRGSVDEVRSDAHRQLIDHGNSLIQRLDTTDMKLTDRMLAMEQRMNEQSGTKIAALEATIGRIGAGFDEAMGELSKRLADLESDLHEANRRVDEVAEQVAKVDEAALEAVKEQLSSAIGEAMLVRIEVDRVVAATDEKLDKHSMRMSEIEAQLADTMDVSAAVQLERLDELERAVAELDPDQFVRKVDPNAVTLDTTTHSEPSFSSH